MKTTLAASLTFALAGTSSAAIVAATGVSGNATATTTDVAGSSINALIDGSGLTAVLAGDESNAATVEHLGIFGATGATAHWITDARNGGSTDYFPGTNPELTFTFAGVQSIGSMYLWGYTGAGFAAGGNTPSAATVEFFNGAVSQGTVDVIIDPITNASGNNPASLVGFGQAFNADSVVVTFTDTQGDGTSTGDVDSGGDRIGAGEIAFSDVVRPVPEPGSLALLGLGGLLMTRRRRD